MKTYAGIQLTYRQCILFFITLFFLNLFILLGSALANELRSVPKGIASKFILNQLNLSVENVIASWYSSMLLLLVALAALLCFFIDCQQKKGIVFGTLNFGWLFFSLIFLTLSLDEMGSFHELIGETALFRNLGFGYAQGWNTFMLLIVLVALFMIGFFLSKVKTSKRSFVFMTIGTLLFLSNPFQEEFEITAYRNAADPSNWIRPTYLILMEEGSEIFGALCFLSAMVLYAIDRSRQLHRAKSGIRLQITGKPGHIGFFTSLPVLLGFTLLTLLSVNANQILKGDDGIAENWFPSVAFFMVALFAFYKSFDKNRPNKKWGYRLLWPSAIFYSAYYGSNMYASALFFQPLFSGLSLQHLLLVLSMCMGGYLLISFSHQLSRILLAGYVLLTGMLFWGVSIPAPFTGYATAALLLGALVMQNLSQPANVSMIESTTATPFAESVLEKSI